MPIISVTKRVWVEGETTITANDIISFEIVLTYDLLENEKQGPGFVHSESYPFLKKSSWYSKGSSPF